MCVSIPDGRQMEKSTFKKIYSENFHKKITLYLNDSCILNPKIPKIEWTKNIYRD